MSRYVGAAEFAAREAAPLEAFQYPLWAAVRAEALSLASYSQRIRAYFYAEAKRTRQFVSIGELRRWERLVNDVRIQHGLEVRAVINWTGGEPKSAIEAKNFMKRPELIRTQVFEEMTSQGDWKPALDLVNPALAEFGRRLLRTAWADEIPLYVARGFVRASDRQSRIRAFVTGESVTVEPSALRASPYAHGRALLIGHMAEPVWRPACWRWVCELAEQIAAAMACGVGWSSAEPGELILSDEQGVLVDYGAELPGGERVQELEALEAFFLRSTDQVPWDVAPLGPAGGPAEGAV